MLRALFVSLSVFFLACSNPFEEAVDSTGGQGSLNEFAFGGGGGVPEESVGETGRRGAQPAYIEKEGMYVQAETSEPAVLGEGAYSGENAEYGPISKAEETSQASESRAASFVTLVSPVGLSSTNPVTFMANAGVGVVRVRYLAIAVYSDSVWTLGDTTNAVAQFAVTYAFPETGNRQIVVQGLDVDGAVVAETHVIVTIEPPAGSGTPAELPSCPSGQNLDCNGKCFNSSWVGDGYCDDGSHYEIVLTCPLFGNDGGDCDQASACADGYMGDCNGLCVNSAWHGDGYCDDGTNYDADFMCSALGFDEGDCAPSNNTGISGALNVPYFYQYFNSLSPYSSCQNTCIAMVLGHYGWSGTPDLITGAWGKDFAQSPGGLATVFNSYAESSGIPQRIVPHTNGSIAGLKALLSAGRPVIVHGYLTSYGHVVVATGYSNGVYTINDPAGKWNQQFKGGFPYGTNGSIGKGITYSAASFELAISSTNGSNYEPLWYHEIVD